MSTTSNTAHTALDDVDVNGSFKRTPSAYTHAVVAGDDGARFAPEAGRYVLYISLACPWANGTLTALQLKGLDSVVDVAVVHPTWRRTRPGDAGDEHTGWWFRQPGDAPVPNTAGHGSHACDDALVPDAANGARTVRELYELAGDTFGKYTTPLLWCTREKTIVNNESMDILRMLNGAFNGPGLARHPEVDLFPAAVRGEAEALNRYIYPSINNGVYRCGFARTQPAYDAAVDELFGALDKAEAHLAAGAAAGAAGPFLTGAAFTWVDLRLYHTLVRFEYVLRRLPPPPTAGGASTPRELPTPRATPLSTRQLTPSHPSHPSVCVPMFFTQ